MAATSGFFKGAKAAALTIIALVAGSMTAVAGNEATTDMVSGRYRIWSSRGVDVPPYTSRPSCAEFFAGGKVRLGFCPFSFDGNFPSNQRARWTAVTPCIENLIQIPWIDSAFNASDIDLQFPDAISAIGTLFDLVNGDSFAFQGFKDES